MKINGNLQDFYYVSLVLNMLFSLHKIYSIL